MPPDGTNADSVDSLCGGLFLTAGFGRVSISTSALLACICTSGFVLLCSVSVSKLFAMEATKLLPFCAGPFGVGAGGLCELLGKRVDLVLVGTLGLVVWSLTSVLGFLECDLIGGGGGLSSTGPTLLFCLRPNVIDFCNSYSKLLDGSSRTLLSSMECFTALQAIARQTLGVLQLLFALLSLYSICSVVQYVRV